MSRRASIVIDFDLTYPGQADHIARELRRNITSHTELRNVDIAVLDAGHLDLPRANGIRGSARPTRPNPKGPTQP